MSTKQIAQDIMWNDCVKIAVVEPHTGVYDVVKMPDDPTGAEQRLLAAKDIYTYMQKAAEEWLIHPDDVRDYLTVLNEIIERPQDERLDGVRLGRNIRYRVNGVYQWVSIEVIYPEGYGKTRSSCVLCIRNAEQDIHENVIEVHELSDLLAAYRKVLKVDISDESYKIIKLDRADKSTEAQTHKISDWFAAFVAAQKIHPDDAQAFIEFADIRRIRDSFAQELRVQRCNYRRLVGDVYRWVVLELMPCFEYSQKSQLVMLFVRDADDTAGIKKERSPLAAKADSKIYDSLTGLRNAVCMNSDIADIEHHQDYAGVGVLVAGINGLAYKIRMGGAEAGNGVLCELADTMGRFFLEDTCYRMGVDEFAVVHADVKQSRFSTWADDFRSRIMFKTPPIASVGYAWAAHPDSVSDLIQDARSRMEKDRTACYKKYPHFEDQHAS